LQQRHHDFTVRAIERQKRKHEELSGDDASDDGGENDGGENSNPGQRSALGTMRQTKKGKVAVDRVAGLAKVQAAPLAPVNSNSSTAVTGPRANTAPGAGFKIFDDSANATAASTQSLGKPSVLGGQTGFQDVPVARVTAKENMQQAGVWSTGGIGGGNKVPPSRATFAVLEEVQPEEPPQKMAATAKPTLLGWVKLRFLKKISPFLFVSCLAGRNAFERSALGNRKEVPVVMLTDYARQRGIARDVGRLEGFFFNLSFCHFILSHNHKHKHTTDQPLDN
jgi:hypothetical protein